MDILLFNFTAWITNNIALFTVIKETNWNLKVWTTSLGCGYHDFVTMRSLRKKGKTSEKVEDAGSCLIEQPSLCI